LSIIDVCFLLFALAPSFFPTSTTAPERLRSSFFSLLRLQLVRRDVTASFLWPLGRISLPVLVPRFSFRFVLFCQRSPSIPLMMKKVHSTSLDLIGTGFLVSPGLGSIIWASFGDFPSICTSDCVPQCRGIRDFQLFFP